MRSGTPLGRAPRRSRRLRSVVASDDRGLGPGDIRVSVSLPPASCGRSCCWCCSANGSTSKKAGERVRRRMRCCVGQTGTSGPCASAAATVTRGRRRSGGMWETRFDVERRRADAILLAARRANRLEEAPRWDPPRRQPVSRRSRARCVDGNVGDHRHPWRPDAVVSTTTACRRWSTTPSPATPDG